MLEFINHFLCILHISILYTFREIKSKVALIYSITEDSLVIWFSENNCASTDDEFDELSKTSSALLLLSQ